MHVRNWSEAHPQVVGADRDADELVEHLQDGRSIVLAGPLGCGKSHLLREMVVELRTRGASPLHVRSAPALADAGYGGLDADTRALLARLRDSDASVPHPLLIVDDAQNLDPDSTRLLLEAVYAGRAAAALALTVPRMSDVAAEHRPSPAADSIVNLWLSGFADRIDLEELQPGDAHALLSLFPGADELDSMARASIIWRADGSRLLLRELAEVAVAGRRQGRDPLTSIRDLAPHGRLADALAAHVRELDDDARAALVLTHHAPGIAAADAARFTSTHVIDALLARRLLHADRSGLRRLTANESLAGAVEREWGPERAQAIVGTALRRLLAGEGEWWSDPLAIALAERWLRGDLRVGGPLEVSASVRERVLVAATRSMNDRGDAGRALAYASLGSFAAEPIALSIEVALANVLLGQERSIARLDIDRLDAECAERCRAIHSGLIARGLRDAAAAFATGAGVHDPDAPEAVLGRAAAASDDLRWEDSLTAAESLLERRDLEPTDRLRAEMTAATASGHLGRWRRAQDHFGALHRATAGRPAARVDTFERLVALSIELGAHLQAGEPCPNASARLRAEQDFAAREGSAALIALAGFTTALAYVHADEPRAARRELDAALSRSPLPPTGPAIALTQLATAYVLALHGLADDARAVVEGIDMPLAGTRLNQHALAVVNSVVAAAEDDLSRARRFAEQAHALTRDTPAVPARARDEFRLLALGHDSPGRPVLDRFATDAELPLLQTLDAAARDLATGTTLCAEDVLRVLRTSERKESPGGRPIVRLPRAEGARASATAAASLTRREREIAELVDLGLSNRDIADRLFLSVRTVESHIYQARAKLDAGTRHELGTIVARWAARRIRS